VSEFLHAVDQLAELLGGPAPLARCAQCNRQPVAGEHACLACGFMPARGISDAVERHVHVARRHRHACGRCGGFYIRRVGTTCSCCGWDARGRPFNDTPDKQLTFALTTRGDERHHVTPVHGGGVTTWLDDKPPPVHLHTLPLAGSRTRFVVAVLRCLQPNSAVRRSHS
jgi:hypothetical protein